MKARRERLGKFHHTQSDSLLAHPQMHQNVVNQNEIIQKSLGTYFEILYTNILVH